MRLPRTVQTVIDVVGLAIDIGGWLASLRRGGKESDMAKKTKPKGGKKGKGC